MANKRVRKKIEWGPVRVNQYENSNMAFINNITYLISRNWSLSINSVYYLNINFKV